MDLTRVTWRKSSHSGNGSDCVEVAVATHTDAERQFLIRDSKAPEGRVLAFASAEWDAFVAALKNGEFDDLS